MRQNKTSWDRAKKILLGGDKNVRDPSIFHKMALIAFFAWVGLGADGLSSSNYGPQEAFLSLGDHRHLALYLAVMTALTVITISPRLLADHRALPDGRRRLRRGHQAPSGRPSGSSRAAPWSSTTC